MALAAVIVVSGCGDADEPDGSATSTATTSVTETSTESPTTEMPEPTETSALPPLPDEATENTPEGAEAFIRYYFDVVNRLHRDPAVGVLADLADADCQSCANAEDTISYLVTNDAALDADLIEVQSMSRLGGGAPDVTRFTAEWVYLENQAVASDGQVVDTIPRQEFSGILAAKWTGDSWVFYDAASDDT
ncbi:hypothetical protein GA707_05970 [Nostocoides sp. F2B08]|uniref:DUF6318 family protein n=1 Tax=Nostocoides sp. F2B08 TaxID=2653936 RepID=UPI001263CC53|nr:DUF6318 family protein [Tetrasphaera sp. F2B08]KAB7745470.1 hypothetical protein GA707_05970 [Tetrasphaera sp. F2B08]